MASGRPRDAAAPPRGDQAGAAEPADQPEADAAGATAVASDESHRGIAVAPIANMQQRGRKLVPAIHVDKDWETLPTHVIHDDDDLKWDPVKLGKIYAREWLDRRSGSGSISPL